MTLVQAVDRLEGYGVTRLSALGGINNVPIRKYKPIARKRDKIHKDKNYGIINIYGRYYIVTVTERNEIQVPICGDFHTSGDMGYTFELWHDEQDAKREADLMALSEDFADMPAEARFIYAIRHQFIEPHPVYLPRGDAV